MRTGIRTIFGRNMVFAAALLTVACLPFMAWGADAPVAGQRPAKPAGKAAQGTPAVTTTPVPASLSEKKTIVINPATLDAIYYNLLKTDVTAERKEFGEALNEAHQTSGGGTSIWYYQNHAKQCAEKQYTTEDQKKAGCLGTDTLNQCATKLFDACFSKYKNDAFLKWRKRMLESADRLEKAQKAYMGKLKMIPEPK